MLTCKSCLEKANQSVSKNLVLGTCHVCHTPEVECSTEIFNNEVSNWHKYSEGNTINSSLPDFEIPENGLYLWLRPIKPTSSKDHQEG